MTDPGTSWPKQGPASYFPSIEKKYGRSIAAWQRIIAECGLQKHMEIVGFLKTEQGMGHGHANALVGWTLAGNVAPSYEALYLFDGLQAGYEFGHDLRRWLWLPGQRNTLSGPQ